MTKKVLIVYATGGMGHVTSARAIEEAFRQKYPDVETKNVDVIDFATKVYKKVFVDGYNLVSAKTPELWGWLYRQFNNRTNQKLPNLLSKLAIEGNFIPFVQEYKPDFIISTHPLPMVLLSVSKKHDVIDILSSMVVTDFGCHSFWVDPEVNFYFVATPAVGQCLLQYNADPKKIVPTGIPIEPKFSKELNKSELQQKFGLKPDVFTLLFVGCLFTFEVLKQEIDQIQASGVRAQFIVVAGRDAVLKAALEKANFGANQNIKVFGFVNNLEELMTVSDAIFSKAGGLTSSECMAKGLPMIINKVIPGQEEGNVEYLVSQSAAIKVNDFSEISQVVVDLINNPTKLQNLKQAALKIGKPKSAETLVDFVYKIINK